ncbi:MAG TPA: NifB/NifX family molybdenum-iron cluster-binding protein [Thermoleophilia bacterium]|jgi:predicted Fe-Mo cluster-binding NifX family protein|nr:NifB/NifX family molybdenum-iron cluster-binding protein [Thermoleophilia bacterium]
MIDSYSDRLRVAVPSEAPGGLDSARSGHFGRSPYFTLVDIVGGEIGPVDVVVNRPHSDGGCMAPVLTLGENFVDAVIVAGIGQRPLLACVQAGIRVFAGEDRADVRSAVEAFVEMELSPVGPDATCRH